MNRRTCSAILCTLGTLTVAACSSEGTSKLSENTGGASGGSRATGGVAAMGGSSTTVASTQSGGSRSTGGAASSIPETTGGVGGNATDAGGSHATGGAETGGVTSTGGAPSTGGSAAAGGLVSTGGAATGGAATGGAATGGSNATGGAATGGSNATGGSPATGGALATGGISATGGATATGGNESTGGATATGGVTATGGATSTGGTLATGGTTFTSLVLDSVETGSSAEWTQELQGSNPTVALEEVASPTGNGIALKTSAVGTTVMACYTQTAWREYALPSTFNTAAVSLRMYLGLDSDVTYYNWPGLEARFYKNNTWVGLTVYYRAEATGQYMMDARGGGWTAIPQNGLQTLPFSPLYDTSGQPLSTPIDFDAIRIYMMNYACIGTNSVVIDDMTLVPASG